MSEQSSFRVCLDRCPEDYGHPEILNQIIDKIETDETKVFSGAPCLGICTKLGGTNNRPEGGIVNFEEVTENEVRPGVFAFNSVGKVTKVYLK